MPTPFPAGKMSVTKCCMTEAFAKGSEEGTNYYTCSKCNEPCDLISYERPYIPRVGDRVSLEGEITSIQPAGGIYIRFKGSLEDNEYLPVSVASKSTLLSRKSPRRVTKKEIDAAFGETVEIVEE